jgi:hypothetical protein
VENRDIQPEQQPEQLLALFKGVGEPDDQEAPAPEAEDEVPAQESSETADAAPEDTEIAEEVTGEDAEPTEEVEAAPSLYDVVVDGVAQQVTLDELKAGYSRRGDYTRKTQAVAEERRKVEADAAAMRAERERYAKGLADVEALLAGTAEEPDWTKLADELEPAEFNRARAQWDTRAKRVHALRTQREQLEYQAEQERQAERAERIRVEQQKLYAAIPEWKDHAKAEAEGREIVDYALQSGEPYGVTAEGLSGIDTAFPMIVLRKAMLYDKMMAAKPKVVAQKVPTPTAKPAAKTVQHKPSARQQAFARLVESGDNRSAEEYFLARLTEAASR